MSSPEQMLHNARALRKNMTREERHLWYDFLKSYPVRIHRQYVFEKYIADFYCHQAKLVIELDGSQHYTEEGLEYDRQRTAYLESKGIRVLRISNLDVQREFRPVCDYVDRIIQSRMPDQKASPGEKLSAPPARAEKG